MIRKSFGQGAVMLYHKDDSIDTLPLSTRTLNALKRAGILTVGSFMDCPDDQFAAMRNVGRKCVDEFVALKEKLSMQSMDILILSDKDEEDAPEPEPNPIQTTVLNRLNSGAVMVPEDAAIDVLPFSIRTKNCLKNGGILTVGQLLAFPAAQFISLHNMGVKSAQEAIRWQKNLLSGEEGYLCLPVEKLSVEQRLDTALLAPIRSLFPQNSDIPTQVYKQLYLLGEEHPDMQGESLIYAIYELPLVALALKNAILRILESAEEPLTLDSISARLPEHLNNTTIVPGALIDLENEGSVTERDLTYERKYPSVLDFVGSISNDTWRKLVLLRLQGSTLDAAGQQMGLTRERVRQITKKAMQHRPRLAEDRYRYLFENYDFTQEDFNLAFGEPDSTYNYLDMAAQHRGGQKLANILDDPAVPLAMKRAAERAIYKDYVLIDGVRMHKDRDTFLQYALRHYCQGLTNYDEFKRLYQTVLDDLGLGADEKLTLGEKNYVNKIRESPFVLWHTGNSFRYYNIYERDYAPLLEELQLPQYDGLELSTRKFFRDYPELMQQYDIRDEYELHNLLKKIIPNDFTPRITFHRMPTIEIGTADRDWQVMELLLQYGESTAQELAEKYEELYGVGTATAIANQFRVIAPYFANGVYSINFEPLTAEQKQALQAALPGELYSLEKIRSVFRQHYPGLPADRINAYTLKSLGFKPYSGYALRDTYSSAVEYFDHILLDEDVVDLQQLDPFLLRLTSFASELNRLRDIWEIIEFSPRQCVNIRRLRQAGYDKKDLENYCLAACRFVEPGSYFTIRSLHGDGFAHPLDDLGFDDWFYASLLAAFKIRFSYQRIGRTRLFFYGSQPVNLEGFLMQLMEARQSIDLYNLEELVNEQYGIAIERHKIMDAIRNTDLYYDAIMEKVYIDYNTYFEEI